MHNTDIQQSKLKVKATLNMTFFFSLRAKGLSKDEQNINKIIKIKYFKIKVTPLKTVVTRSLLKKSTRGHQRQKTRTNQLETYIDKTGS